MPTYKVGIVDVFAHSSLSGNPLAVVEDGAGLDDDQRRAIAREFNQSETTFLQPSTHSDIDWELRSFTAAGNEVLGAGHNALGAWLWLGLRGMLGDITGRRTFRQKIGTDVLPVHLECDNGRLLVTMEQAEAQFGQDLLETYPLAMALGLDLPSILLHPAPRVVATGASHLLVRLKDKADVDRASPRDEALLDVLGNTHDRGCYIYALQERAEAQAYTRFFNPSVGLVEDPATGSAAGPLAAYLNHSGMLDRDVPLIVEQGTKLGRKSLLVATVRDRVELSGTGVIVMTGNLHLN